MPLGSLKKSAQQLVALPLVIGYSMPEPHNDLVRIKGFKLLILESQQRHQPAFLTVILQLYH